MPVFDTVWSGDDMEDDIFLKHLAKRHAKDYLDAAALPGTPRSPVNGWMAPYREFHERVHRIAVPGQHDHDHAEYEGS